MKGVFIRKDTFCTEGLNLEKRAGPSSLTPVTSLTTSARGFVQVMIATQLIVGRYHLYNQRHTQQSSIGCHMKVHVHVIHGWDG